MTSKPEAQRVHIVILSALLIGMIGWIVNQTHLNALETAKISSALNVIIQKVDDGKEARLKAEQIYEDTSIRLEGRIHGIEIEMKSMAQRLSSIEAGVKSLN